MNARPSLPVLAALALAGALLAGCTGPAGGARGAATADAYRQTRPGELTGSVSWLQRRLPPSGAELEVRLVELTRPGAPLTLAQQRLARLGAPPWRFRLDFDPARIDATQRYAVQARIELDGRVRYANHLEYPVLTRGAPTHVDMVIDALSP